MGNDRPLLLGLVCWVLIILGTYGLYTTMKVLGTDSFQQSMAVFPYPAKIAVALVFGTLVIMIVCGICMYERQGWARWPYVFIMPAYLFQRFLAFTAPPAVAGADAQDAISLQTQVQAAPVQTREEILITVFAILYVASLFVLFHLRVRRYFHPPLYVDE